ncbi:hypothetical protein [Marinobacter sp. F3R08]|uniref:hypothetical protein n=1 Tax=Marinobacter sp. F3R08 TaxID=2841559 RepID=UPI001C099218|nr:hypothetical protein [Marinobacter sp. F3R08]MBU2955001.1 hypothetical protein [Marinobacter sp. F3R08]
MFKYETPPWGARLICFSYFIVSFCMLIAFYTYNNWSGNSPVIFKYVFLMLGLVFLVPALKPGNWKGWVYFSADNNGLSFPASFNESKNKLSLGVPWENVGIIKSETLYGNVRGISIELKISKDDIESHFGEVDRTNKFLGFDQKRGDYFVVAYANNAFQRVSSVVDSLNAIKRQNL